MRKVMVYEWKTKPGETYNEKVENGLAIFHEFGVNYEEFESNAGNYSTAIIERKNGEVENVPVDLIQFVDDLEIDADPELTEMMKGWG